MTIRSEKLNSSLSEGLRNTAPSDSASERPEAADKRAQEASHAADDHDGNEATDKVKGRSAAETEDRETSAPAAPTQAAPTPNATA